VDSRKLKIIVKNTFSYLKQVEKWGFLLVWLLMAIILVAIGGYFIGEYGGH